jgi:hypothetical protein
MSTFTHSFTKDPDETLDYSRDWTALLQVGEAIVGSQWIVSPDNGSLITSPTTFNATAATVWVSGGTLGSDYLLTNRITTNSTPARTFDRTFRIQIRQR